VQGWYRYQALGTAVARAWAERDAADRRRLGVTIPVLEVGGTHVTAALIDDSDWSVVPGSLTRSSIRAQGSADEILDDVASAAASIAGADSSRWAIAIPGPFDYVNGIGRYEHVGKFDSLNGVDVRAGLARRIHPGPRDLFFLNDADAYGVGEYATGAGRGAGRLVCITLGTGIGSSFLDTGEPVTTGPSVPRSGDVYTVTFRGRALEDTVSRRAIRAEFARRSARRHADAELLDVHEIAELARSGDATASAVLFDLFSALGEALGPVVSRFGGERLVIGGSMAGSWDLVEPALRAGLGTALTELTTLPIRRAQHPENSPIVGAAYWAAHRA
jgi:glucokinase